MEKQTCTFVFEKGTKNTVRYKEQVDGKPPVVGALYVQKWALGGKPPKTLTMVVEPVGDETVELDD